MQNMAVDSLIENIKTKIVIQFRFINFMTYLARVANSMVIFSASYGPWRHKNRCYCLLFLLKKHGRIHGNTVADGWPGAVMRKPLAI